MIIPSRRAFSVAVAAGAAIVGTIVALHYNRLGLTLSHYDARGHLIVARRIIDNITPGWQQIGAVWLPLPHLLNALPVQVDAWYRSGASGVVISIVAYATAVAAVTRIVAILTSSTVAAICAALVFALNPNLLYLQSTPMTEPLLLGLILVATAMLIEPGDRASASGSPRDRVIGWVLALACLTRYEAWPIAGSAVALAYWAAVRNDRTWRSALDRTLLIGRYPAIAVLLFMGFSKVVVGQWFVSSGFFIPDNPDRGQPLAVLMSIVNGLGRLSGRALLVAGALGLLLLAVRALRHRSQSAWAVPLSILAAAALPFLAFLAGHPFRIRYMVTLLAAQAIGIGFLVGRWKRFEVPLLGIVAITALVELRPLGANAPMVLEAQWDVQSSRERQQVTSCLREGYQGEAILASMGSLGHYMQELSHIGLNLRDFIHEGNGELWQRALTGAKPFAGWVLISENPDGRDALIEHVRSDPQLLEGFERVCEGGMVALYRRTP